MRFTLGRRRKSTAGPLEQGWQLCANPTTLDAPGTVFRIDPVGTRFLVERLDVEVERGAEAVGRLESKIQIKASILARFLGFDDLRANAAAGRTRTLEFEITAPEQEVTSDVAMREPVRALLQRLDYDARNRYFVVRATRSATAMRHRLSNELVGELGGGAALTAAVSASASVNAMRSGTFELVQAFPQRMRVMFLAEEIKPVTAGLAGEEPELGLTPVQEVLVWEEPKTG